jgi:predicted nucleic acid-binding protein
VSHYLDTSIVVAMLQRDAHSSAADTWLSRAKPTLIVSDFCAVEFSAVISRRVRMNLMAPGTARLILRDFDEWLMRSVHAVRCGSEQMTAARQIVQDFTTKLNAPDAIHLAMARHLGSTLATFDKRLADAARSHGVPVVIPA